MRELFEWAVFWLIVIGSGISILGLFYFALLIQPVC